MAEYKAWFRCIDDECGETYSLDEIVYRCKKCKNLLEVYHDLEPLKQNTAREWKELFDDRYRRQMWPHGSSVWGKKEWVIPSIKDANIVSMYEGATNLFWAERFGKQVGIDDIWIKMCGNVASGGQSSSRRRIWSSVCSASRRKAQSFENISADTLKRCMAPLSVTRSPPPPSRRSCRLLRVPGHSPPGIPWSPPGFITAKAIKQQSINLLNR